VKEENDKNVTLLANPCWLATFHQLLFVFWRYNPLWLYFHNPVAGFSLLVFEVS
jgi:hypothetical protein